LALRAIVKHDVWLKNAISFGAELVGILRKNSQYELVCLGVGLDVGRTSFGTYCIPLGIRTFKVLLLVP
jgi:hypothetical protein